MDHEAIRHAVAAYALDSLAPEELERVQRELLEHLPGCEECTSMLRDFRETVADLAIAAPPASLSHDIEQRVLDAIRNERPAQAVVSPQRRRVVRVAAVLVAAALVASWVTTGVIVGSLSRERAVRDRVSAALSIAGDPAARVTTLQGRKGRILVAVRPDGRVALMAAGIATPPDDRVLELWLFSEGRPVPVAVFSAEDGSAVVLASVKPGTYEAAAITYERGFVSSPTGEPVYQAELRA